MKIFEVFIKSYSDKEYKHLIGFRSEHRLERTIDIWFNQIDTDKYYIDWEEVEEEGNEK